MEYVHVNDSREESVYLYRADDVPMVRSLGFYRTGGQEGAEVYFR